MWAASPLAARGRTALLLVLVVVGNFVLATELVRVNSFVFVVVVKAVSELEPGSGRQRLATHIPGRDQQPFSALLHEEVYLSVES